MVQTDDICAVTQNVLGTMLKIDPLPVPGGDLPPLGLRITGCIQISGEWSGAVIVQTSQDFASKAACKLLMLDPEGVSHEDRQDTIAELTNMIGGNIKSVVPGPSFLSMPSVATGQDFDFRLFGASVLKTVPFACDGEPFSVVLCQRQEA